MIARLITGRIIGNRVRSNIGSMKSMASLGKANERHFGAILKANFTSAPAAGISTNLKSIPLIKPKSKRIRPQLVTLTEAAKLRLKELLLDGGMLRIATKQKGCSGMPYLSRLEHSDLTSDSIPTHDTALMRRFNLFPRVCQRERQT